MNSGDDNTPTTPAVGANPRAPAAIGATPAPGQPALDRPHRPVEIPRRLLVRPALEIAQDQRRSVLARQAAQFQVQHLDEVRIDSRAGPVGTVNARGDRL